MAKLGALNRIKGISNNTKVVPSYKAAVYVVTFMSSQHFYVEPTLLSCV